MSTPYSNVYAKITKLIQSYKLASLTQLQFESYADGWISEASSVNFIDCTKDLTDRDETLKQFNQTLSEREEWIVSYSCALSWINITTSDESLLQNSIGDRDYQTYSPANLLKSLLSVQEQIKYRMDDAIEHYKYEDFEF